MQNSISDRLCEVWEGVFYATGQTDENGCNILELGSPRTARAWWYAFEKHVAQLWRETKSPQIAPLAGIAKARGAFNLSDPITFLVWRDFLDKFPERVQAFEDFERDRGAIEILIFHNA